MTENEISEKIIGCAIEVHRQLGPGLLESVYEEALCYELSQARLEFKRQQPVPIKYKKVLLGTPLRLDLIVEGKVIDNKAKSEITPIDKQQLLTYSPPLRCPTWSYHQLRRFKACRWCESHRK